MIFLNSRLGFLDANSHPNRSETRSKRFMRMRERRRGCYYDMKKERNGGNEHFYFPGIQNIL